MNNSTRTKITFGQNLAYVNLVWFSHDIPALGVPKERRTKETLLLEADRSFCSVGARQEMRTKKSRRGTARTSPSPSPDQVIGLSLLCAVRAACPRSRRQPPPFPPGLLVFAASRWPLPCWVRGIHCNVLNFRSGRPM